VINIFAKESRLIVIFFLTVIILGSLLVYLSINNISNYKELTEKKISEQQHDLAKQFTIDFQSELEELVVIFEMHIKKDFLINKHWFKSIDAIPAIKQAIVMNKSGVFLWPHFTFAISSVKKENSPLIYLDKIKIAQQNEFVVKDYNTAEANYLSALKTAKNASDSTYVFNAVSRLYLKSGMNEKVFKMYSKILLEFSYTTNASGFPYAYFSVNELLKINDPSKNIETQNLLNLFLSDLSDGKIPLNYSTSDLLARILEWTTQIEKNKDILKIEELVHHVSDYLTLINNYKTPIEEFLNEENLKIVDIPIGDYNVLKPVSGITDEVLLFNKTGLNSVGFTIDLEELFDQVKQQQFKNKTRFENQIELVNNDGQNYLSNSDLINFSEFSLYFNSHRIKISLKNEDIVNEYILKRKLLYGIGFVLLLGVMSFGLILLVQNVKREKQMEGLKADFVSNVTHELKTPLTSIQMFADSILLGRIKSDIDLNRYAKVIVKESEKLKRMINNILEFSRKENDKLIYQIKETNLTDLVNITMEEMNYWLEISNFKVIIELEPDVWAKVEPESLKQALSNLISNAIKYSVDKKKLIIRLIKKETKIFIEIEDFGIGIPKNKLKLIFEKFYRVNLKENETTSGTGLGLTVTKDIIEAQNGKLLVESTLGKGSKFTIVLNLIS